MSLRTTLANHIRDKYRGLTKIRCSLTDEDPWIGVETSDFGPLHYPQLIRLARVVPRDCACNIVEHLLHTHTSTLSPSPSCTCLSVCRMREVEVGEGKALLVYQGGEYMACGHKCTHYGAPLAKGYLGNGRVRCPWHGACFNVKSGDIEDFPGLDGIAVHQVWGK